MTKKKTILQSISSSLRGIMGLRYAMVILLCISLHGVFEITSHSKDFSWPVLILCLLFGWSMNTLINPDSDYIEKQDD